jgi:hypothetical protein
MLDSGRVGGPVVAQPGQHVEHFRARPGLDAGHRDHGGGELRDQGLVFVAALEQAVSHSVEA